MAAAGVSPSSSPRLPSPPPFTEVQIGPKSPSVGESFGKDAGQLLGVSQTDDEAATRRIRPGTKAVDMAFGPPLIPLSQLDSPFQLQEHLKALYNHYTRPEGSETVIPINRDVAIQLAEPPEGVDRSLWLYELCRFLTMKVNNLIIAFFAESPPCTSQTCPEMRASEWQYLCAVHDPPKSCCAIDYCCHTLDWATNILTSPKYFPSRLTLGSEAGGGPQASMRHLTNIFRRLYRIFAHAWFQHRDVFWTVEGHDGLYIFFKTVCDLYSLIPEDNYTVPAEAEGLDTQPPAQEPVDGRRLTILRKEEENPFRSSLDDLESSLGTAATTRRHKHSPSTGSHITTITESTEDFPQLPDEDTVIEHPESQITEAPEEPEAEEEVVVPITEPKVSVEEVHEEEPQKAESESEPKSEPEPVVDEQEQAPQSEEQEEPAKTEESTDEPTEEPTAEPEASKQETEAEAFPSTEDAPPAEESQTEPETEAKESSENEAEKEAESEPAPAPTSESESEEKPTTEAEAEQKTEPTPESEPKEETEPAKET